MYACKRRKNRLGDAYRHKQSEIASAAFQQQSLASGLIMCLS